MAENRVGNVILGKVVGRATATVKHPTLTGQKLLLVQPVMADRSSPDGDPLLVVDGVEHAGCVRDTVAAVWEDARIRGVDYRAVGNEPGWHLEIVENGRTVFVGDYGATQLEFATPVPRRARS